MSSTRRNGPDPTEVINKKSSFDKKLYYSTLSALLFIAVSLPFTYSYTNAGAKALGGDDAATISVGNCPTYSGTFLHTFVFFALSFLMMWWPNRNKKGNKLSNGLMAKYSFYSTLIYFLLASTDSYKLTGHLAKRVVGETTNVLGCPTTKGVIVHGLVYLVVILLVMYFPADNCECPFVEPEDDEF